MGIVAQTRRIELNTELSGPCALFIQRLPIGPDQSAPRWECRAVDELGVHHRGRFHEIDELVAFLRRVDGLGAGDEVN